MNVGHGKEAPHSVNVIIEITAHSSPVKYEVDKTSGTLFVDRFMTSAMVYPCNYGYIPNTLAEDGDPVDVLVITPFPIQSGCVIAARPIGMLRMEDEAGQDNKVLAVPTSKICKHYDHVMAPADLPQYLLDQIRHFFKHYKDLDAGKWVKVDDWQDARAAHATIEKSIVMAK